MNTLFDPNLAGVCYYISWALAIIVGLLRAFGSQDLFFILAFQYENKKLRNVVLFLCALWLVFIFLSIGRTYPNDPLPVQALHLEHILFAEILVMLSIQVVISALMIVWMVIAFLR